jgi:hypothetical protein
MVDTITSVQVRQEKTAVFGSGEPDASIAEFSYPSPLYPSFCAK